MVGTGNLGAAAPFDCLDWRTTKINVTSKGTKKTAQYFGKRQDLKTAVGKD
jgi:hypothetical protein